MPSGGTSPVRFLQRENRRLQEENDLLRQEAHALRRYVDALTHLQRTVQHFTPEQDVLALLDETLDCALVLLNASDGSLLLADEETDELVFVLVHGTIRETLPGYRIGRSQGIAGWVANNISPAIVNNVRDDPRFLSRTDDFFGFETQSLVAVPLAARGKTLGVLEVVNKQSSEGFDEEDANLLSILATISASALDYAASTTVEG